MAPVRNTFDVLCVTQRSLDMLQEPGALANETSLRCGPLRPAITAKGDVMVLSRLADPWRMFVGGWALQVRQGDSARLDVSRKSLLGLAFSSSEMALYWNGKRTALCQLCRNSDKAYPRLDLIGLVMRI